MTKRLISFFLALFLLAAIPLSARYRYNPYTNKLDYYEAAGDIDLGDIGDITLTGLANGDILYYNGAAWVNLTAGGAATVLTIAGGIPSWQAAGAPAAHAASHWAVGADALNHNALANWVANQHVALPATIAAVLTDHNLAAHTALGLFDASGDVDHNLTFNYVALEHIDWTNATQNFSTQGSASLNDNSTTGEIGLNLYGAGAGPQFSSIVQSDAEGAGTELRIGVDETTRTIQILDRGDIGVNFPWGGLSPDPTLYFVNKDADKATLITNLDGNFLISNSNSGITGDMTFQTDRWYDIVKEGDTAGDNTYGFFFGTWEDGTGELTDTDAEQSWIEVGPYINQTNTAWYIGLLMDVTETSIGGGVNELMALRVAGADQFTIDRTGAVTTGSWTATAIAAANGGTGVNSGAWTDYVYVTGGVWAVDATLDHAVNGIAIAGAGGSSVTITNDNVDGKVVSSTASLILESTGGGATVEITGDLLPSADATYDLGNNTLAWQNLIQTATGIHYYGDSDVNGSWGTYRSGATLTYRRRDAGAYVEKGYWGSGFGITMTAAVDQVNISQSSATGTEDAPLIFIDDDRADMNEQGEASLVIDAEGTYAMYVLDGYFRAADRVYFDGRFYPTSAYIADDILFRWGTGNGWLITNWDANGAGDGLFTFLTTSMASANQTEAFFFSNLNPTAMTDHDNYLSPTLVITNDEAADANDYAGVVIGERVQASVLVAHYFDFYAMTGATDGTPDANAAELAAIFRFGASGTATPGYATTPGDVLFEGAIEVDGNTHIAGYRRADTVYWIECFDHGIAANRYSQNWDITSLNTQGAGTNTIDTTPSEITLTTDNNAIGDNEGTISHFQIIQRARQNRTEWECELGQTANTQYYMGWNTSQTNAMVAAADEYVIVFFDVSDNANWQIKVGDGATEDVFTSAVAGAVAHIIHEVWVETDGTVHWAVNGTELDITGSVDNLMTASDHYLIFGQAQSVTGAAAIVAEIDFVENEKTKAH